MNTHPQQKEKLHAFHRMHSGLHIALMVVAVIALAILISVLKPGALSAGPTDNVSGWAWSGVAGGGWISLNCTNDATCATVDYGVHIDETSGVWSGSGWSSNVGWVDFNNSSCGSGPVTDMSSGVTTGFAKVRTGGTGGFTGCINMAGNGPSGSGGVILDVNQNSSTYGQMSGFAWSGDDVTANIDNTPANEWTNNGIADVGLGWIDFSQAVADLELDPDADVVLYLDGQCNSDVTFTWDTDNVDESSCVLSYTISTDPSESTNIVPGFDAQDPSFTQLITGFSGSNLIFSMTCDDALDGSPVTSPTQTLVCVDELAPVCDDGIDNDGDGDIDGADETCQCSNNTTETGSCLDPNINPNSPLNQTDGQAPIYIES